ncbi:class I SAM-dependent methyltransferase [Natronomonas halophila]|uniref:class I SAM-dependent methyltransferase n=1 Tax=Natronomonas halophila TaxID=2747817 RepID=UPI001FE9A039|nr:class I SAM-dependent methyltransferase family protein [Natronomonas halophila]
MSPLAALVSKPRTQDAIDALRAEGVYDSTRSVAEYDNERVAIPVHEAPAETAVDDTRKVDLPTRARGLDDVLAARGASEETITAAPSSWAVVGDIVLADFGDVSAESTLDADEREIVGEALLELHGNADTVLARGGISGTRREPSPEVVAGTGETETVHVEHGTNYAVDFSKVMFSPGNKAERARMGDIVGPGERVFDMFAGIGYFTLPMARAGAEVTAAEINPESFRLLVENARLNDVSDRVEAVLGDCRDVETTADRVVMGYYDGHEYLDSALDTLVSGGTLHLHEATPEPLFPDRPVDRLTAAADQAGRSVEIADTRVVKSHSEGVVHAVVDAVVE